MDFENLISRLALALGIGLLVGIERGWSTREGKPGQRAAGIRTFTIIGVLGGVLGAIAQVLGGAGGGLAIGFGLVGFGGAMAVFCLEENRARGVYSATTWVAAMLTCALGAFAVMGDMHAAAALAVGATLLLALRQPIHGWVEQLTWPELRSALVLLAMTFIALPILPAEPIGPFGGLNLREVWIIAIVLAAASFAGYAAVKYYGASLGVLLGGAAGGLASSTAVTVANARRAAASEGSPRLLAAGVAMASAVMFIRVCAIVFATNAKLLTLVGPPLLAAAVAAAGYGLVAVYCRRPEAGAVPKVEFRNPFAFWSVIGFAVFLGAIIVIGRAVGEWLGAMGAIVGAAVVGIADVDAVTVSLSRLVPETLAMRDAAVAILAAVATDTVSKIVIGAAIGRGRFAAEIAGMAALCFLAGGLVILFRPGLLSA